MQNRQVKWNERIRKLREHSRCSQEEIAGLLKISQRAYCDYESGRSRIPVYRLIILAKYYDCCMDYISGAGNVRRPFPLL